MPNATHLVPQAPAIAGLSFRHVHGADDADALCAIHQERAERDQVDPASTSESLPSREQVRESLAQTVANHEADRYIIAQVDERVVGYNRIIRWPEGDGTWVYLTLGWVTPDWRGRGLATAMLHWAEERSRGLAALEHPDARCEFAANASSTEAEATALVLHEGYRAGYTVLEMGLDASTPVAAYPLPSGFELRPARPEHLPLIAASVREAYQHEYAGGRFNDEFDFDLAAYAAQLTEPKHDPTLWQVAWEGDQIAGQVLTVNERGRAQVFEVSVRPAWRRRRLARALLSQALQALRARGMDAIRLHTVAEFRTRARDLYASVGFRVLKEFPRYRKAFDGPA